MFEIILFSLVCVTGLIIAVCRYAAPQLAERYPEPWYLDYARSFFPVLLLVFLLRGFIAEPFRIPSGSMLPTLEIGDFILVNKFTYGVRLPILHNKLIELNDPDRGDIVVFHHPPQNKISYIKRMIGLPGDEIEYRGNDLFVNGQSITTESQGTYTPFSETRSLALFNQSIASETTGNGGEMAGEMVEYSVLFNNYAANRGRKGKLVVPDGHYFVMGDNRDNSADSRSWGLVPDKNIIGKAFFIWFHWDTVKGGGVKLSRVGADIQAQPVVTSALSQPSS